MPSVENSVEDLLREYLSEAEILKDKITSPKFDFGFIVSFPPGPKSQNMSVYKPKSTKGILITIRFQISQEKARSLNSLKDDKKRQFFIDLQKFLLIREVMFRINPQTLIIEVHDQIFPNKENYISKNSLFKLIQKVFYCYVFSNILLDEYLTQKRKK